MESIYSVACDLGSSGGKIFLGSYTGGRLNLEEIHRFSLQPMEAGPYYYTDVLYVWGQILQSLKNLAARGIQPHSMAVDSWGVDYAYLAENGELLGFPLNYRNGRTLHTIDRLIAAGWDAPRLYELTGNAVMPYNTLFQIYEDIQSRACMLKQAKSFLFIPDLFAYWLCGSTGVERTIASTSQMTRITEGDWAVDLLKELGFPTKILPSIQECGTQKGMLRPALAASLGLKPFPIIAGGSHDTASAVAAAPLEDENSLYLSSGSWSLLGIELRRPVLSRKALEEGFTNEGGAEKTVRFLRGINGLWILQLLQRKWGLSFPELIAEAEKALPCKFSLDITDERFYNPGDIEEAIIAHCRERGQGAPSGRGQILAAFYQGAAEIYGQSVHSLEELLGIKASSLHIVGGGSRDGLLNGLTAKALGIPVTAGPTESSALGNILIQLKALGCLSSLADMRVLVRRSFDIHTL